MANTRSRRKSQPQVPVAGPVVDDEPSHLEAETSGATGRLRPITLRLGVEQIAEARRLSKQTTVPYQTIIRRWIAEGATRAQQARRTRSKR